MQKQEDHSNLIPALNVDSFKVDLVVIQNTCSEKEDSNSETASSKSVKESSLNSATKDFQKFIDSQVSLDYDSQMTNKYFVEYTGIEMQTQESLIDTGKVVDADLVITESSGTESEVKDNSSRLGNDTDADDADIRPIYDEEPMAEVQLTAECNIFAIGQQHTEQPEIINEGSDLGKVLGKPVLQSPRNQSVVRQPNAFKSERPQMSKQRFASQVDVNNNLSRLVTKHYLPKKREFVFAKPDHMIAFSETRNSSKSMPRFSSNDMVHNHYLDEAKKKTQEIDRNSNTNMIPSARLQSIADGSKPKPRSTNHLTRSLHVSKSSCITITAVPKADHSKRKLFDSCTGKDDSEPTHGSNIDIPNIHESKQTLDLSASTSINVQRTKSDLRCKPRNTMSTEVPSTDMIVTTSMIELESQFGPFFNEYFNGENQVVSKSFAVTTADVSDKRKQQPDLTSSTSALAITVTADGNFDL
ncbi:hypothetical protein Tco_0779732 [Tanacetum coccineum]